MANQDYKSDKVVEIIREFENTGNMYEVNGIDTSKATIFWRRENEKFQIVPSGSYTYDSGNTYLVIQDEEILQNASEFQIVYIYEQSSSSYDEDFPQLEILVNKYNQVINDLKDIYKFLGNTGIKADTLKMTKVLPELEDQCVWWLNNGEIASLPISEMYKKFDKMVNQVYEDVKKLLLTDLDNRIKELITQLEKNLKQIIDEYTQNTAFTKIDEHAEEKIVEVKEKIDEYIDENLPALRGERGYSIASVSFDKELEEGNTYNIYREDGEIIGNLLARRGPQGKQGNDGPEGKQGIKGDRGHSISSIGFSKTVEEGNEYIVSLESGEQVGVFIAPKGPQGPEGKQGEKGEQGNTGITVPLPTGQFAMGIEDGKLYVYYNEGETPPTFSIEDGKLYMTVGEEE